MCVKCGGKRLNTELKNFLDSHLNEDTGTNTLTVFPLPCGVGKSEYITYLLAEALQNDYGLIVVTDEIDRLNNYTENINTPQTEQLTNYIKRNLDKISILNSQNISNEIKAVQYKPIVLMTTQRYFNLSIDEITNFTSGQKYKRNKIVFDEKIYLLETRKLTIKSLDEISTALKEELDNTVNQQDKQWLVSQYDSFNSRLQQKLMENEQQNNDTANFKREVYFNSGNLTISEDEATFNDLVKKYKYQLRKNNIDILKNIEAINKLLIDGAVTSQKIKSKKINQEYKNYFTVVTNNADKLVNIGAKVFVLDGTADISPEYRLKCINMVDCSRFNRDLSNLTINIVNINTSKDRLTKKDDKTEHLIQTIIDYIKSLPLNIDTIFTYKAIANKFTNDFTNVNHFGNIKGSNQYREINNICQVGLNRWSELVYMLYANEIEQFNHPDKSFNHRIYDKKNIDNIRCSLLLEDFEQNLYRCKIRNTNNTEKCTYTLICNVTERNGIYENYQPLANMIKSRYEPLGATVNIIDTPTLFRLLKTKERKQDTNAQRIIRWLESKEKYSIFKIADMLTDLNLSHKQFDKIKKNNIYIMELFNNMKTENRGYYGIK